MNIRQQLEQSLQRYEELERMMGDPQVLADSSKMAAVAREHGSLLKTATKYRQYKQLCDDIRGLTEMAESEDADERAMAGEELELVRTQREALWTELLNATIGGEDANRDRCVMEIRAGTGGEEAALFAR
ncbi:MAG: PCRF domain-containing protein, partial [Pirellulaceae bacterium]